MPTSFVAAGPTSENSWWPNHACWLGRKSGPATSTRSHHPGQLQRDSYSLCRLNAGPGGENPDEPPDRLYGLQVRGSPFSLGGSLLWVLWGEGSVWGVGFAVRRFICAGKLYCPAHWVWAGRPSAPGSWGRYVSGNPVGERKGSWMVGYLCSCSRCAVTRQAVVRLVAFQGVRFQPCTLIAIWW